MKIAVMSDLHLEFDAGLVPGAAAAQPGASAAAFLLHPPQPRADLLVLAGDIHSGTLAIDWARRSFTLPTLLIAGNHEAYGHELFRVIRLSREKTGADGDRVVFLERASWEVQRTGGKRVRFLAATLWTDFRLYGAPEPAMAAAQERLPDFTAIRLERGYQLRALQPSDTVRLHRATLAFLRRELGRPFPGPTVVVTHHAPSPRSVAAEFAGDPLNPAFTSNLDALIATHQPALWIHGHMHHSLDYRIGRTRIICNPRGYFPDQLNPGFDPALVVDLAE